MNYTADEIENAAAKLDAILDHVEAAMLRAFAAERRMIEGPNDAITKVYEDNKHQEACDLLGGLEELARTLAAALEQERKDGGYREKYILLSKQHVREVEALEVENEELRAVFECARSVLRNNVGGSKEHAILFNAAIHDLDDACEAVKLRDSGLADEYDTKYETGSPAQERAELNRDFADETINAATVGAESGDSCPGQATRLNAEKPAVAAPDQEGLDEEWSKARAIDLTKNRDAAHMVAIGDRLIAALRNSAKPAAEWIPVSERLPDETASQSQILCYSNHDMMYVLTEQMLCVQLRVNKAACPWTHWMPLPSPPSNNRSET